MCRMVIKKDPLDKNKWIIDEPAAEIVRKKYMIYVFKDMELIKYAIY